MVHIRKVREKIEENPRKPRYIKQYGEWGIRLKRYLIHLRMLESSRIN